MPVINDGLSDTMLEALIGIYVLPDGYVLCNHYWFDQYGRIDETDQRWSIVDPIWRDRERDRRIYVRECLTYNEAMIEWMVQLSRPYLHQRDGYTEAVKRLLEAE